MLIPHSVHIWREADGDYHLEWQVSTPQTHVDVEVSASDTAADIEFIYSATGARLRGLPHTQRHSFFVRDQHGTEVVASERRLGMQGTPNFRDFGGYTTADGRQLKWGYLFRSGQLSTLSDRDIALLQELQLDLVCDFRRTEEQAGDPSRLPRARQPRVVSLPIVPGSNARFFEEADSEMDGGPRAMFDFMLEINRDFAHTQTDTYARMFNEILAIDDARFLVHCAAGKDRTGFAAALILLALGVPRETVMWDYLLTARFFHPHQQLDRLREKYQMEELQTDAILPMLEAREEYLATALHAINQNYPSVDAYLEEALGVDASARAELRGRYLQ